MSTVCYFDFYWITLMDKIIFLNSLVSDKKETQLGLF